MQAYWYDPALMLFSHCDRGPDTICKPSVVFGTY